MNEDLTKFIEEAQKEIDKKASTEIKPFYIKANIKELKEKSATLEEVEMLDAITPAWYRIVAETDKDDKVMAIREYFMHDIMGDEIIKKYHLVRYPALDEGAIYEENKGTWRYFRKKEMLSFVEKEVVLNTQKWGVYDRQCPSQVSRYVRQKTYDSSYSNETPFERSNPALVPFKNGTYNILTNEMRPHDPKDYILTSYNYNLDISGAETPATDNFFNDFFGEAALFMKQFLGYTFYRSHTPSQEMVFLKGDGGEGKSSFLNMLTELYVTGENRTALTPQELATDKFALVGLLGKTLNVAGDIEADYISESAIIKRITGGDVIKGEYKGVQSFNFVSYSKHIFSMNDYFRFADLSMGFSDRLAVVPITIGNQRKKGADFWKKQDLEGIKREAPSFVYGCIQEFKKIFDGKRANFTYSQEMKHAKTEWLFENDRIAQFIHEACEINIGDSEGEIASTVVKEYRAFSRQNGYTPKSAQELTKWLDKRGVPRKKSRKGYNDGGSNKERYQGLKLLVTFLLEI